MADAQELLGEERYEDALDRGRALGFDEAVAAVTEPTRSDGPAAGPTG